MQTLMKALVRWWRLLSGFKGEVVRLTELCSNCKSFKRVSENCLVCKAPKRARIITPEEYYMGRDKTHSSELTDDLKANAVELLTRVNKLIGLCPANPGHEWVVTSGWRPKAINERVPGAAKASRHLTCEAIDLKDPRGYLAELLCKNRTDLLVSCELYAEHPSFTKGWVHLQSVPPGSGNRIFIPYAVKKEAENAV